MVGAKDAVVHVNFLSSTLTQKHTGCTDDRASPTVVTSRNVPHLPQQLPESRVMLVTQKGRVHTAVCEVLHLMRPQEHWSLRPVPSSEDRELNLVATEFPSTELQFPHLQVGLSFRQVVLELNEALLARGN
mmetsp:Transcript_181760/g.576780  ORF Transcript_181760/g.576780 Transcript_181760/m.576780 type:complete len:131 (+) Transcript_181760:2060-2452(+)